jgi:pSer/pThr/pTyr-binding forkhead associated (FHA) protein
MSLPSSTNQQSQSVTTFRLVYTPKSSKFQPKIFEFTRPNNQPSSSLSSSTDQQQQQILLPGLAKRRGTKLIPQQIVTVGRNPSSTFPFPDEMHISMKHLTLEQLIDEDDDSLFILLTDSSSNGTIVGNRRRLEKGDKLRLEDGMEIILPWGESNDNIQREDYTIYFQQVRMGNSASSSSAAATTTTSSFPIPLTLQMNDELSTTSSSPHTSPTVLSSLAVAAGTAGTANITANSGSGNILPPPAVRAREEWILETLKTKSDHLALDAARLSTVVFSNTDKVHELLKILEIETNERTRLKKLAQDLITMLKNTHHQLLEKGQIELAQGLDIDGWESKLIASKRGELI